MTTSRVSTRAKQKAPRGQRNDAARMSFASWLVLPPSQREPKTQQALGRALTSPPAGESNGGGWQIVLPSALPPFPSLRYAPLVNVQAFSTVDKTERARGDI